MQGGAPLPLYEYKCLKCGRLTEKIEGVSGPYLKKCPQCGGKVESVITAPSIQFKGSGWYVTDYASKPKGDGKETEKPAGETKEAPAAKDSSAKESSVKESSSKETSEKKPAKKK